LKAVSSRADFFASSDDVFWLIDPDGGRRQHGPVRPGPNSKQRANPYAEACRRKYGGKDAWRAAVAGQLASWRLNTLGSWSDEAVAAARPITLAVPPNLDLAMSFA
jgi:agarase